MGNDQLIIYLVFIGGILARIVGPYVTAWVNDTSIKFDFRYLIGQILTVAIAFIADVLTDGFIAQLADVSLLVAFGMGWAIPDIGREAQKIWTAIDPKK